MDEKELERILRAVYVRDMQEAPNEHRYKTPDCPPLPRFRELVYRPSTLTDPERSHMPGCRYCEMTLKICEQEAYHPPAEFLAEWRQPVGEERELVGYHLKQDCCERCLGLIRHLSPLLANIPEELKAYLKGHTGLLVWGGPKDRPSSEMAWNELVAAAAQQFAAGRPPRLFDQYHSEDRSVTLTLRESDAGDLMLHAETQNPALNGTPWHFALIDEANREVQSGFVVLYAWFDQQRWVAEISLGSLEELIQKAEGGFHVEACPIMAEHLSAEHRAALLWSVEAIAGKREAATAWELFLEKSLGRPLPHAVTEMLMEVKARLEDSKKESGPFSVTTSPIENNKKAKTQTSLTNKARNGGGILAELVQEANKALDALGRGPVDGSHNWERLVGSEQLLWRSCEAAVKACAIEALNSLWERRGNASARLFVSHEYGEALWQALWGVAACAQAAARAKEFDINGVISWALQAAECFGGARNAQPLALLDNWLSSGNDPAKIVTQVYKALQEQGCPVGRPWDTTLALLGAERKVLRSLKVGALGYQHGGFVASLVVGLVEDGSGEFYPDPTVMAFVPMKRSFGMALDTAWRYACQKAALPRNSDCRWHLEGPHLPVLDGASVGLAAAVALRCLLENRPIPPYLVVSGAIDESGCVHKVQHVKQKVAVAAEKRLAPVIVPSQNESEARALTPAIEGLFTTATVDEAVQIASGLITGSFYVPIRNLNFTGRDTEIQEVEEILRDNKHIRVIGLFGMGGVGKTTAAVELCYRLRYYFKDGAVFLTVASSLLESILDDILLKLGFTELLNLSLKAKANQLQKILSEKSCLIVLDNADDGGILRELLDILSTAAVVVTSRKRFINPSIHSILVDRLRRNAAISLLLKTACIEPSDEVISLADQICDLLGDLPLAIVLLAARKTHLNESLHSILDSLKGAGLDELASSLEDQDSPSVRYSFDRSFHLLDTKDQEVFATLGAFGGESFTLEAVAACTGLPDFRARLAHLAALSMVQVSDEGRYNLHPLLRLYAQEKIRDDTIGDKVADYYFNLIWENPKQLEFEITNIFNAIDRYYHTDKWDKEVGQRVINRLINSLDLTDALGRTVIVRVLCRIGGPAIDALIDALHRGSFTSKYYAAMALGLIGHPRAADSLLAALSNKNAVVQRSVISALGKLKDPKSANRLIDMLASKHADVRAAAKEALLMIRNPAIDPLIQALNHRKFLVRYHATQILGEIPTPRAVPALVRLLEREMTPSGVGESGGSSNTHIVKALKNMGMVAIEALISLIETSDSSTSALQAMNALIAIGAKARGPIMLAIGEEDLYPNPYLAKALKEIGDPKDIESLAFCLLKNKNPQARYDAAKKLTRIASPKAVPLLIDALRDKYTLVRSAAAEALGEIKAHEAINALVNASNDKSVDVRYNAVKALGNIQTPKTVRAILAALKDKSYIVRSAAVESLSQISDPTLVESLIALLKDKSHLVRSFVCIALGNTGNKATVEPLRNRLRDRNSSVVFHAAEALGKIGDLYVLPDVEEITFKDRRETAWGQSVAFAAAKAYELITIRSHKI